MDRKLTREEFMQAQSQFDEMQQLMQRNRAIMDENDRRMALGQNLMKLETPRVRYPDAERALDEEIMRRRINSRQKGGYTQTMPDRSGPISKDDIGKYRQNLPYEMPTEKLDKSEYVQKLPYFMDEGVRRNPREFYMPLPDKGANQMSFAERYVPDFLRAFDRDVMDPFARRAAAGINETYGRIQDGSRRVGERIGDAIFATDRFFSGIPERILAPLRERDLRRTQEIERENALRRLTDERLAAQDYRLRQDRPRAVNETYLGNDGVLMYENGKGYEVEDFLRRQEERIRRR